MAKSKIFGITGMSVEYRNLYDDLCGSFGLTRAQLMVQLLDGNGIGGSGIDNIVDDEISQAESELDVMIQRGIRIV
jgi:hypothetical protein